MNCEDCRRSMPDLWEDALPDSDRATLEMHLASCVECREEAGRLSAIWNGLGRIPLAEPSRAVRARFYERLESYRHGLEEARIVSQGPSLWQSFKTWWTARPLLPVGLSLATLVIGFAAGFAMNNGHDTQQLSLLKNEVTNMRQMVALSLLQQQAASDRLKGVDWAYRIEQPDTEVLSALLHTLNHDPNVNVRLAAVDALRTYSDSPLAKKGLVQAIPKQDSPLVQIALIDQVTDLRDRGAVPTLQALLRDQQVNPEVRQRAQWALGRIE